MNTESVEKEIDKISEKQVNPMIRTRQRVKALLKKPQPVQRSPEWFHARNSIITASEVASCLTLSKKVCEKYVNLYNIKNFKYNDNKCANAYESLDDYIVKKCRAFYGENVFIDSVYTLWGKKYEQIAVNLYKKIKKTDVYDFGLLRHPYLKWLGASPDGITPDGVMLEIKCPYSRKIKDNFIPFYYYTQVQQQLECCLLDEADYMECEIKEIETLEEYNTCTDIKGIIINNTLEPDNSESKYIYQDPTCLLDPLEWVTLKINEQVSGNVMDIDTTNMDIDINTDIDTNIDVGTNIDTETNVDINMILNDTNNIIESCNNKTGFNRSIIYYKVSKYSILNIKRDQEWFNSVKDDIKKVHGIITYYQQNKEEFLKYKESVYNIKNKKHIESIENSVCLL